MLDAQEDVLLDADGFDLVGSVVEALEWRRVVGLDADPVAELVERPRLFACGGGDYGVFVAVEVAALEAREAVERVV